MLGRAFFASFFRTLVRGLSFTALHHPSLSHNRKEMPCVFQPTVAPASLSYSSFSSLTYPLKDTCFTDGRLRSITGFILVCGKAFIATKKYPLCGARSLPYKVSLTLFFHISTRLQPQIDYKYHFHQELGLRQLRGQTQPACLMDYNMEEATTDFGRSMQELAVQIEEYLAEIESKDKRIRELEAEVGKLRDELRELRAELEEARQGAWSY